MRGVCDRNAVLEHSIKQNPFTVFSCAQWFASHNCTALCFLSRSVDAQGSGSGRENQINIIRHSLC